MNLEDRADKALSQACGYFELAHTAEYENGEQGDRYTVLPKLGRTPILFQGSLV